MKRLIHLFWPVLFLVAAGTSACASASRPSTPAPPAGVNTPSTTAPHTTQSTQCTIPQNNGGDHDSDNNGGPNDGDGCDI